MPLVNSFAAASGRSLGFGASGAKPPFDVLYVVLAGGGGGGANIYTTYGGGGGGGGGVKANIPGYPSGGNAPTLPALTVDIDTAYPIIVGAGGTRGTYPGPVGTQGSPSTFGPVVSTGGGYGGHYNPIPTQRGGPGGSGGGLAGQSDDNDARSGLSGQGYPGGNNFTNSGAPMAGTGGGGATSAGTDMPPSPVSNGTAGGDGWRAPGFGIFGEMARGGGGGDSAFNDNPGGDPNGGPSNNIGSPFYASGGDAGGGGGGGGSGYDSTPGMTVYGGNGGGGFIYLFIPTLYDATFSPGVTAFPVPHPTYKWYNIPTAGPTDTVTFS